MSTPSPAVAPAVPATGLHHLPLPLFAAPMGLGGLGLAWREAGGLGAAPIVGEAILGLAAVVWLLVTGLHLLRALRHPQALAGDLKHPIRSAFAGAFTIAAMLLAGGLAPHAVEAAAVLWIVAVALHLVVGVWTVRGLLAAPREAATLLPPLVIPLVGNIVAPIVGVRLGFESASWALFGIGALLWVLIQPAILLRIATGPQIPDKMKPTFAILLAPPAVGAVALAALTHGFGPAPLAVWGLAAFVAAVLLTFLPSFRRIGYSTAWLGYTFPSAAFAAATVALARSYPGPAITTLAWIVLAAATAIVALVAIETARAAFGGTLLRPDA